MVSFGAVLRSFPEASRTRSRSWSSWAWAMRLLGDLQETGLRANDAGCSGTGSPKQEMVERCGGLEPWNFMTVHILGMSSSQLTFIFFGGVETTNQNMLEGILETQLT